MLFGSAVHVLTFSCWIGDLITASEPKYGRRDLVCRQGTILWFSLNLNWGMSLWVPRSFSSVWKGSMGSLKGCEIVAGGPQTTGSRALPLSAP